MFPVNFVEEGLSGKLPENLLVGELEAATLAVGAAVQVPHWRSGPSRKKPVDTDPRVFARRAGSVSGRAQSDNDRQIPSFGVSVRG